VNVLHSTSVVVPVDPQQLPSLLGGRCGECATVVFPKMPVCPACRRNGTMKDVEIGQRARLFSHTIARVAPTGFKAPFFQAFVDLDEGPRIFTLVGAQCPVEDGVLEDGMPMRLVIEPLADTPESKDLLTYKYVPIAGRARGSGQGSGQGSGHA
jgi:uncharacterized OB-fold protein